MKKWDRTSIRSCRIRKKVLFNGVEGHQVIEIDWFIGPNFFIEIELTAIMD